MVDYVALKAEIAKPEYAGMSDEQIIATLSVKTYAMKVDVSISDVESYLRLHGLVFMLRRWVEAAVAANNINPAVVAGAELIDMIESPRLSRFETSNPQRYAALQAMLGGLVQASAGGMQQADMDALLALANHTVPVWPNITTGDLQTARAQP